MSYRLEQNGEDQDLVIEGFETGVAPSPHKGIANIQGGNISTETGEVTCSFNRVSQWAATPTITNGTLTASGGAGDTLLAAPSNLHPGAWIHISASTITANSASFAALVVGGGGSGGTGAGGVQGGGGGGGAGEVNYNAALILNKQAYAISVGGASSQNESGNPSSIGAAVLHANGGGVGGGTSIAGNGGSGGGGGSANESGGSGINGFAGGNGTHQPGNNNAGGGGGGAAAVGTNATYDSMSNAATGGNGGVGVSNSISGAPVTYGGGGAGHTSGGSNGTAGAGAIGLGGDGGNYNGLGSVGAAGIVIISYPTANVTATGGTITTSGPNTIHTFTTNGTFTVTDITSTIPVGDYYVSFRNGTSQVKISPIYDPTVTYAVVHGTSGTATFSTLIDTLTNPLASAVEKYNDGVIDQYRYYVLDSSTHVWVYDTAVFAATLASSGTGTTWVLPDRATYAQFTGIGILNGWLFALPLHTSGGYSLAAKPTSDLGRAFIRVGPPLNNASPGHTNTAFTGHQGRMYWTDGNYIGSIFPDTSTLTGSANIQSYAKYTAATIIGTVTELFSGSLPQTLNSSGSPIRIPVTFLTDQLGTLPDDIAPDTVYYIEMQAGTTFIVFDVLTGGLPLNLEIGAIGNQFFNTFYLFGEGGVNGANSTVVMTPQRLNLPTFEISQCIGEIGNTVLIGCKGNIIYPWNQIDATPSSIIALPESNVLQILTVNQMAYLFAGNQGNIYITDGSVASLVINIPDYCAGVPGSPGTYIESNYFWGGVMYLRGRVYFSVRDQTATKAGNAGGIWSFVPTQNLYIGQDTGIALRLEAQNSYNTYNGEANLLIPNAVQDSTAPLYWSPWSSSVSSPTFGIDYTNAGTDSHFPAVIETDGVPIGTLLNKKTYSQVEYKLSAPLDTNATVTAEFRVRLTDTWTPLNTFISDADKLSGYVPVNFEKIQWLQLRFTLTPITSTADTNTFIRFRQIRVR